MCMRLAYLWSAITGYLTKTTGAIQGMFAWTSVANQLRNARHVQVTYSKFMWLDVRRSRSNIHSTRRPEPVIHTVSGS